MRIYVCGGSSVTEEKVHSVLDSLNPTPSYIGVGQSSATDLHTISWAEDNGVEYQIFNPEVPIENLENLQWTQAALMKAQPDLVIAFKGHHQSRWVVEAAKSQSRPFMLVPND